MEQMTNLRIETMRIAESPRFARSCKLRNLLLFLMEHADSSTRLTQFDLATRALGRSRDFDETTDTSVRTSISRLRHLLAEHYAVEQPHDGLCVHIPPGEYRLRAAGLETAYPELASRLARASRPETVPAGNIAQGAEISATPAAPAAPPVAPALSPSQQPSRKRGFTAGVWLAILLLSVTAAAVASAGLRRPGGADPAATSARASPVPVPIVAFRSHVAGNGDEAHFRQMVETEALKALQRSMISRAASDGGASPDYIMHFSANKAGGAQDVALLSLVDRQGTVLEETSIWLSGNPAQEAAVIRHSLHHFLSPIGAVAADVLKKSAAAPVPASGYECFLWVENGRAKGADASGVARDCLDRFPQSPHRPYLEVRDIFYRVRERLAAGGSITDRSPEWRDLSAVLNEHPDNPYALVLAAKMLVGQGRCADAVDFARRSFSRGRTYVAMELTLLVDAFGCDDLPEDVRAYVAGRFAEILGTESRPAPLIETYLALGRLALGQPEEAAQILAKPFAAEEGPGSGGLRGPLRRMLEGRARPGDRAEFERRLRGVIHNRETRRLILQNLPA